MLTRHRGTGTLAALGWPNDSVASDRSVLAVDLAEAGESTGLNCVKIAVHSFQSIPRLIERTFISSGGLGLFLSYCHP